ncbi:uncharacterized protein LOC132298673 [Cornus florida]|uniref:uncharacterized protein LOC132298673 n=1 Tax=Cornus florida TaxID=4283 RepID=UPI0028A1E11F|nr:uncharacterized protein LOC132298673 [Cornus florida]
MIEIEGKASLLNSLVYKHRLWSYANRSKIHLNSSSSWSIGCSDKKMSNTTNKNEGNKKDRFVWTQQMEDAFIDVLYYQHIKGNRVDGTFTSKAYDEMVKELCAKLEMDFTKDRIKNRLKTIKTHFNEWYDLFKNGLSGFAWSGETKMWSAEPEVWNSLIEAKPQAEKWRTTPINNYDKLLELFAKDRATGDEAATAKEKRFQWASSTNDELMGSIDGIDQLVAENEVTLENVEHVADEIERTMSHKATSIASSSAKGKRKRSSRGVSNDTQDIANAISSVAESIKEGNALYGKYNRKVHSEEEIYNELESIGLEPFLIDDAYFYLANHPDQTRIFLGVPVAKRKNILEKMMYGST